MATDKNSSSHDWEPMNIVVLGGSFAGLSVAHNFLCETINDLGRTRTAPRYRMILVSPSTHLYWNIGAPRSIVSSTLIPLEKSFLSVLDAFRKYPVNRFTFVHGLCVGLDFAQRNVAVSVFTPPTTPVFASDTNARLSYVSQTTSSANGSVRQSLQQIPYHALVIATGSYAESPLLSLHGPHEKTVASLTSFQNSLRDASSIIIAGGGPSGVECAGQLATYFNRGQFKSSSFSNLRSKFKKTKPGAKTEAKTQDTTRDKSPPNIPIQPRFLKRTTRARLQALDRKPKNITVISGNERLLPRLPLSTSEKAEAKLRDLGVHVVHDVRVISAREMPSGVTQCTLSNDLTISSDLYIAATGVHPNTQFLPPELLDASGYVLSDPKYLRVARAGERVYAIGDCAAYSKNTILDVYESIPTLMHNMRNDLWEFEFKRQNPYGGGEAQIDALEDIEYVQNQMDTQLCPITRWGGVGVLFGIKLPSFAVWAMKGRDYRTGKAKSVVNQGNDPYGGP
jgi:apoptosis-inducing factor 2